METIQHTVITSLDGRDVQLYPYIAYLLQDLWAIGSSPELIITLIRKHQLHQQPMRVLDLGCGKGAISVHLAKELGFHAHGIDAFPAFIDEANQWAHKYNVAAACHFAVGDIRTRVDHLHDYDLAILGSIGPVIGDVAATLTKVRRCVTPGGYIILDDAYLPDESDLTLPLYLKRAEMIRQIQASQVKIIDEYHIEQPIIAAVNDSDFAHIQQRAWELMTRYPDKQDLFAGYVTAQAEEIELLEHHAVNVIWLLQRVDEEK